MGEYCKDEKPQKFAIPKRRGDGEFMDGTARFWKKSGEAQLSSKDNSKAYLTNGLVRGDGLF